MLDIRLHDSHAPAIPYLAPLAFPEELLDIVPLVSLAPLLLIWRSELMCATCPCAPRARLAPLYMGTVSGSVSCHESENI